MDARNPGFELATIYNSIVVHQIVSFDLRNARYRQTFGQHQQQLAHAKKAPYEDIESRVRSRHTLVSRASQGWNLKSLISKEMRSLFRHTEHKRDADQTSKSSSAYLNVMMGLGKRRKWLESNKVIERVAWKTIASTSLEIGEGLVSADKVAGIGLT